MTFDKAGQKLARFNCHLPEPWYPGNVHIRSPRTAYQYKSVADLVPQYLLFLVRRPLIGFEVGGALLALVWPAAVQVGQWMGQREGKVRSPVVCQADRSDRGGPASSRAALVPSLAGWFLAILQVPAVILCQCPPVPWGCGRTAVSCPVTPSRCTPSQ